MSEDKSNGQGDSAEPAEPDEPDEPSETQRTYNIVSDVVAGPNLRRRDNVYQAIAIAVCTLLGIAIGYFVHFDRSFGAILGGFFGLLAGLFGSGLVLGVYRGLRHLSGKHD